MIDRSLRAWSPWAPADAIRWAAVAVVGHGLWFAGWWLAHRQAVFGDQVRWATLAVAGFIVAAYADVSWLLRARWSIVQRRRALLADDPEVEDVTAERLVAGPGRDRFHRAGCALAAGRHWPTTTRDVALAAGQQPCGMCEP